MYKVWQRHRVMLLLAGRKTEFAVRICYDTVQASLRKTCDPNMRCKSLVNSLGLKTQGNRPNSPSLLSRCCEMLERPH